MHTRNVVLTDHQHEMVERLVNSGRYQNASEVLRDGLRLLEQREDVEEAKLDALKAAAQVGWREIDDGRFTDVQNDKLEDFIGELGVRAAGSEQNQHRK
ncbi:type II toxin-antitoxin system ParD family antitoxin [Sodalis sp. RH22]|uniref:type II toxin-antitoxin system ParD family antitoxin n=1 Tax=unclassified Sodalis (in: enterobacteria) TaxID=2636512 RepID=UPI0039B4A88C